MKSLYQLILAHFKTFFREPGILFWAVLFPIIMAWVLGIAFSNKGETVRAVYVIGEKIPPALTGEHETGKETGNPFLLKFIPSKNEEAVQAIKRGVISVYIEVADDSVIYHFDPHNPDAQLTHLMLERELTTKANNNFYIQPLETKGTRYIDFLIPGLIALGIMNSCLWGISWTLIEMRMKKLLRRMVATPMKKSVFLSAQIITRIILGITETILLYSFAFYYFGTEIIGSVLALIVVFLAGIFAFSGIAIFAASRTAKSEIGNGIINAVTLTMTILSGIFFNYHNFPDWAIPIIQALPLTILADALRSIFVEGAGFGTVYTPILILCATGLLTFLAGLRAFKWY